MMLAILVVQFCCLLVLIYMLVSQGRVNGSASMPSAGEGSAAVQKDLAAWISLADEQIAAGQTDALEAAFARHPSSRALFDKLANYYLTIAASGENLMVRRAALSRISESVDLFRKACSLGDFNYSIEVSKKVEQITSEIISAIEARQKAAIEREVKELEDKFKEYQKDPDNEDIVNQVARIDESINKDAVKAYPELFERYTVVSKRFVESFQKRSAGANDSKDYNLRALKAARAAWKLIQEHDEEGLITDDSHDFNKETHMKKLIANIGGWDSARLFMPTSTYISSVYAEIFGKLKPEARPMFTELMIKEEKKM